ncbi:hypothetical protein ACMFMG_008551 [Clarireedia jacksonii]
MPKHPTPSLPSSTSSSSKEDPKAPRPSPSARDQGWELGTETRVDDSGNITCSAPKQKVEHGCPALSPYSEGNYTYKPAPRGIEPPRGCRYDYCTPRTSAAVTEAELRRLSPSLGARRGEGRLDIDDGRGKERITDTKKHDTNKKREKQDSNDNSKVNGGSKTTEKVELASQLPRSTFSDDDDDDDDDNEGDRCY